MSYIKKAPWVIHFDGDGCGGCGMETAACFAPVCDMERYGIAMTDVPAHADILLVTGPVSNDGREELIDIYENMQEPKAVVAAGACACCGGIFADCSDVDGGADYAIPVDVYVPGCAVRPDAIADGILKCLEVMPEPAAESDKKKKKKASEKKADSKKEDKNE